jgi:putative DNA primase/helicase
MKATGGTTKNLHLDTALLALKVGLSPIPPTEDGLKRPIGGWKRFQTEPAPEGLVREWYGNGLTGNGLVCGVDGVECFEFDDGPTYKAFLDAAWALGLNELCEKIQAGYDETTPGGGVHWLYRCYELRGNTKLAMRPKRPDEFNDADRKAIAKNPDHVPTKTLIETRGEGGFVVTAPSCGKVHPSGKPYVLQSGGLETIVTITEAERDALWDLARTFDEIPEQPPAPPIPKQWAPRTCADAGKPRRSRFPDTGISPGTDYETRMTWADVLEPFAWVAAYTRGQVTYWRRPGKDKGWSATTGHCKGFKCFTSSTAFKTTGTYTRFGAYTLLSNQGNFTESTRYLAASGYGTWIDNDGTEHPNPSPKDWKRATPKPSGNGPPPAPGNGPVATSHVPGFPLTDMGNAERLVARHGANIRYCHPWEEWVVYDGRRWARDQSDEITLLAKETVRHIYIEAGLAHDDFARKQLAQWAFKSEARDRIAAMIALARSEPGVAIMPDQFDTDPAAFNFRNGTLNLRTLELRPHDRGDMISKLCDVAYDAAAKCPQFEATLDKFLNPTIKAYLERIGGCAMYGAVRNHILPIAHGSGNNGKTTILGAFLDAFGTDYAMKASMDLLVMKKRKGGPSNEKMDLYGKRLVVAMETEDEARLNEVLVKELTGGDRIRGRSLYENEWEFTPSHTIIVGTNHMPEIHGTDEGIWRRLKQVPFDGHVETSEADLDMPEKLKAERPGIMALLARGCKEWLANGLQEPEVVTKATTTYQDSQNQIKRFLDDKALIDPSIPGERCGVVYDRYKAWSESIGEDAMSFYKFSEKLAEKGIKRTEERPYRYPGLGLRPLDS